MHLIHAACIPVCLLHNLAFVLFTVMLILWCIYGTLYKFGNFERAGLVIGHEMCLIVERLQ